MSNEIPEIRIITDSDMPDMYQKTLESHRRMVHNAQNALRMNKNKTDLWIDIVTDGIGSYGGNPAFTTIDPHVLSILCLHAAAIVDLAEERNIRGL